MEIIIVGGFPRAGTRQFTDILNGPSQINIKGECFPQVIKKLSEVYALASHRHSGHWSDEQFQNWRLRSVLNSCAGLSKGSNAPYDFKNLVGAGFKSPRVELISESLETLFLGNKRIKFFYCVRKVTDNFLSENSTFNISVEDYIDATKHSLKAFFKMSRNANFDCTVLSLDDFINGGEYAEFAMANIFSHLDSLRVNYNECVTYVQKTKNINATKNTGKVRRKVLKEDERLALAGDNELNQLGQTLKQLYGVEIL